MARKIYIYTLNRKSSMNARGLHPSCVRCNDKRKAPLEFEVGDTIVSTHSGNSNGGHTTYYCMKHAKEVNLI